MKTFLKVLLLLVLAIVAVKLLPITLAAGFVAGLVLVALAVLGLSVVAGILTLVGVAAVVLAPVWIPVLALIGLIALVKRMRRTPGVA